MVELAVSCMLLNAVFRDGDDGDGVGCGLGWLGVCVCGARKGKGREIADGEGSSVKPIHNAYIRKLMHAVC